MACPFAAARATSSLLSAPPPRSARRAGQTLRGIQRRTRRPPTPWQRARRARVVPPGTRPPPQP
eukprot:7193465-Lingulodinium_polyedra.AAC.1